MLMMMMTMIMMMMMMVTRCRVGDRVGVGCVVDSCMDCETCAAGEEHMCCKVSRILDSYWLILSSGDDDHDG